MIRNIFLAITMVFLSASVLAQPYGRVIQTPNGNYLDDGYERYMASRGTNQGGTTSYCQPGGQLVVGPSGLLCRYSGNSSSLSGFAAQHIECSIADRVGSAVVNSVAGALIGAAIDRLGHTGGTYTGAGAALGAARGLTMTCTALVRQETVQVSRRNGVAEGSDQAGTGGRSSAPTSAEASSSCKDDNGPVLTGYACAAYQRAELGQTRLELPNGGTCHLDKVYYGRLNGECLALKQWLNARNSAQAPIHMNDRVVVNQQPQTTEVVKNAQGKTCAVFGKNGEVLADFLATGSTNPLGKPVTTGPECNSARAGFKA